MIPALLQNLPFFPLATERLTLRPLQTSDADIMAKLANDMCVAQMLKRLPHPYSLDDAHEFITIAQQGLLNGARIDLAIIHRTDQQFMGIVGLEEEFGYWLGHEFWGQGFGKEAAKALVQFAFHSLKIDIIKGSARKDNTASRRIFEGLGFRETGSKECTSLGYQGTKPGVAYALSRRDFLKKQKSHSRPILWAVAAVIMNEKNQFLLAERPEGKNLAGIWEPPGGKIEPGETPEHALIRELKEELDIDVREEDLEPLSFVSYPYENFYLVMPFYLCRKWENIPRGVEGQKLIWAAYPDLVNIPVPPADIPLFHRLEEVLRKEEVVPGS